MTADAKKPIPQKLCICCHGEFSGDLATCPNDGTALSSIANQDLVGTLFNDTYEILNVIGGGGMGMVYRARHRFMKRIVAIKVLHKDHVGDPTALKRFQLEAQAASALSIPNIVTIFDFGTSPDGEPYMVMDFLEGRSLAEILEAEGRFSVQRALNIFIQISRTFAHSHGMGIIHRDIKPSNIVLVNSEKETDFVKIVDFGIAKLLDSADSNIVNLTRTGEVFGSPLYMSPEQWRGQKLDARTDIYSLGSVMYRVLSGAPLYEDGDVLQLMYKQVTEMPASFESLGITIPHELATIIFKALAKDPDLRYQSMIDLTVALEQFKEAHAEDSVTTVQTMIPREGTGTVRMELQSPVERTVVSKPNAQNGTGAAASTPITDRSGEQNSDTQSPPSVPLDTVHKSKEQKFKISMPKRAIGVGLAVALLGGLTTFLVLGPLHRNETAPVQEKPALSTPEPEHEESLQPLAIPSMEKNHDTRSCAKEENKRFRKHRTHQPRSITPAPIARSTVQSSSTNSATEHAPIPESKRIKSGFRKILRSLGL